MEEEQEDLCTDTERTGCSSSNGLVSLWLPWQQIELDLRIVCCFGPSPRYTCVDELLDQDSVLARYLNLVLESEDMRD